MTGHDDFDQTLVRWFDAEAVAPAPSDSLERIVVATRGRRPRPDWLAAPGSHWLEQAESLPSSSGVGAIPRLGLRWSTALVLLLVIAALLGGAIMVGGRLLQPAPRATGQLGHLAYDIDGDVFVADWDGRNPRRIADGLPVLDGPSPCGTIFVEGSMWSPDGQHLAYRSDHGGGPCPGTVHVTDPEGDEIASFSGTGWRVSWSPDSTRVATWVDDSESRTIGIYGIDGLRQAVINLPPEFAPPGDYDPLWSPDGGSLLMKLAPLSNGVGVSGVWELPIDGGTPKRVPAEDPRSHWNVQYSPDDAQAAFVDGDSLVVGAVDGSASRVLASGLVASPYPAVLWSPTGDRIAFSWTNAVYDEQANDTLPGTYELRVLDLASGSVTSLVTVDASDPLPLRPITFSPEGDQILFSKADGLWSVKTAGSDAQLVVSGTSWGDWQWQEAGS